MSEPTPRASTKIAGSEAKVDGDPANAGIRREPDLPEHEEIIAPPPSRPEFGFDDQDGDDEAVRRRALQQRMRGLARQASLDPGDGLEL